MNPTDPMTPVRALIEAAGKATPGPDAQALEAMKIIRDARNNPDFDMDKLVGTLDTIFSASAQYLRVTKAARAATASISQLLSEHDKVVEYIKELREQAATGRLTTGEMKWRLGCADRLQSIVEGK